MNNNNKNLIVYKNINKKNFFLIIKKDILLILNNKYNINININLFKKQINNLYIIKKKIKILIKKILNKIKYKYYKKKIGYNIKAKVTNIFNKQLILNDKYNNELLYYIDNNKNFKINNYYFFLVKKIYNYKDFNFIKIILSRKDNLFIKNLLKFEIPEIFEGIIKIKKIVRIPGIKSKVVVNSNNKNLNIIGTCLGIKCTRLNNILKELGGEKIDFIQYSKNIYKYINRVFFNININKIDIKGKQILIYLYKYEKSKLIGKYGNNIKLCTLLLNNYKIIIKC